MDIARIDKNFQIKTTLDQQDLVFYDVCSEPFEVCGVQFENGCYRRLPEEVARCVSKNVYKLHTHTAGGRVRFLTDSPYIAIHAEMHNLAKMSHFPLTGSIGLDLYSGTHYLGTYRPPFEIEDCFESVITTHQGGVCEYTVNLPLYAGVTRLLIGVKEGSVLESPFRYPCPDPIVFYGSSITQGGCASRPGNAYTSIVARTLHYDHINLGFSGSGKAEDAIAEHIAGMPMAAFVYDYDYNAPTPEYLAATHERMFQRIRAAQPDLPVLMLTRPQYYLNEVEKERLEIIRATFERARAAGDQNVYFIAGPDLISPFVREVALVDNCHPNDAGFVSMAQAVGNVLSSVLK